MDVIFIMLECEKILLFLCLYVVMLVMFVVIDMKILLKVVFGVLIVKLMGDVNVDKLIVDMLCKQLKGKMIGIQLGIVYMKFINDSFKDIVLICVYKMLFECDFDLVVGCIDVLFDDVMYYVVNNVKKDNVLIVFVGLKFGGLIWGLGEGFVFCKQDVDLKMKFDMVIVVVFVDGIVKKFVDKWFKIDVML